MRSLSGHVGKITALAVSPDGSQVATAAQDLKVKLWDAASGRELLTHDSADEDLLLAFSPDGKKLLAWHRQHGRGDDETGDGVTVFDADTLKPIDSITDRGRRVSCLALSSDGTMIAMGSADGSVRLWDLAKKERVGGDRPMLAKSLWDLALSPDKSLLIAADKDGEIKVAPVKGPGEPRTIHTTGAYLDGLLVSPDGKWLAAFGDGRIELWDFATLKSQKTWTVGGVRSLAFSPDSRQVLAGLDDSTLYLLNMP